MIIIIDLSLNYGVTSVRLSCALNASNIWVIHVSYFRCIVPIILKAEGILIKILLFSLNEFYYSTSYFDARSGAFQFCRGRASGRLPSWARL